MLVGLQQGCPLSSVLFIILKDSITRHRQREGVQFGNYEIAALLFAQDVVLLVSSNQDLQLALGQFTTECEAAGMRISTSKFKAMILDWKKGVCTLQVGGLVHE